MLTIWQQSMIVTPRIDPNVLFMYDPATNTDLVTGLTCGTKLGVTTVDNTVLIDGHPTVKMADTDRGVTIAFPTPINLNALPEWTIEWSSLPTSINSSYANELNLLDAANTASNYVGCRWTDGGFANALQFTLNGYGNSATIWRSFTTTKAAAVNKISRYAMVFKNNQVIVYRDGARLTLTNGSGGSGANQTFINKIQQNNPHTKMFIGWANSTYVSTIGNAGRVRISNIARYDGNYTPAAF